ncbi:DUF4231 domain-containing protein [Naasia aerilata]|uniref:DUF4231 domain-containing protein n=1 Tax=Naasia aerilata TaxID=1162966 RepID=A0ABM8GFH6_9MICO|nr:DUF4231 domain-containing protein [Naasia aerilata]BDZ47087.1 hypothetical protein GCM10025866_29960 [Naasia aerilata]
MELAPFCAEADAAAAWHQRRFFRIHLLQLVLVVAAAVVAAVPIPGTTQLVLGVLAAVFFGVSLVLRVVMAQWNDESGWYAARRAAESAKSLCYRYAFGATDFERSRAEEEVEKRFIEEFGTLGADVLLVDEAPRGDDYSEVTEEMRRARALEFESLRRRYFGERIEDQERWFSSRAVHHLRRSRRWITFMLIAEVAGLALAVLKATGQVPIDLGGFVGVMSALAAAFLAWTQLRQHSTLAASYRAQAVALRAYGRRLALLSEEEWPGFVAAVEGSLTAEHSRWQSLLGFGR